MRAAGAAMSVQAIAWVFDHSPERHTARLVLLSLANHAGPDGSSAFPSVATIMQETRLSHGAVCKALKALEDHNAIERIGRRRYGTVVYQLAMRGVHGVDTSAVHSVDTSAAIEGSTSAPEVSTAWTQTVHSVDSDSPQRGHEPSVKPSTKPSREPKRTASPKAGPFVPGEQRKTDCTTCDGSSWIDNDEDRTSRRCPDCHPALVA